MVTLKLGIVVKHLMIETKGKRIHNEVMNNMPQQ